MLDNVMPNTSFKGGFRIRNIGDANKAELNNLFKRGKQIFDNFENEGDVFISRTEGERNPIRDSLLSLLMLALSQGTIVFLETEPSYSEDFHNAIARCFEAPDDDAHAQVALDFQENYNK